jgi:hypothetical protein
MNIEVNFKDHFLWEEFGKNKQETHPTPNIFCNILLQYFDNIKSLKNITKAIETGTYEAHSAMCLSKLFDKVETIELFSQNNPYNNKSLTELYENIKIDYKNINFHFGKSHEIMENLFKQNPNETFFILLDAHTFNYSPMLEELKSIQQFSNKKDHVIMIDDCRFLGANGYPKVNELIESLSSINSEYKILNTNQGNGILLIYKD